MFLLLFPRNCTTNNIFPGSETLINVNFFICSMDIKELSIGKLIEWKWAMMYLSVMNGGKTESLESELKRAEHAGFNVAAFNPKKNDRDGSSISVNGVYQRPAYSIGTILQARDKVEKIRSILSSNKIKHSGCNQGMVKIDGIKFKKNLPLSVVGIDEINLFCLTERDTKDVIEFIYWCRDNQILPYFAGLKKDFRHNDFGYVQKLEDYVNISSPKKPVCKGVKAGVQCGEPAIHTQRLWSLDFVKDLGLESLLGELEIFSYVDKERNFDYENYVAAPYFDQTLRIEAEKTKQIVYLPVCDECSRLPYEKEVFDIYYSIIKKEDPIKVLGSEVLTKSILEFLSNNFDGWVKKEGKLYVPKNYYRNRLGSFSPFD